MPFGCVGGVEVVSVVESRVDCEKRRKSQLFWRGINHMHFSFAGNCVFFKKNLRLRRVHFWGGGGGVGRLWKKTFYRTKETD